MDLTLLFSPVDEAVYSTITSTSSFFKNIQCYGENARLQRGPSRHRRRESETRGAGHHAGQCQAPDEVRKKLYHLKRGTGSYRIVDLGNLKPGVDLDETYVRLSEVCRMLLEENVPIIIGGSHDLDYGQYWAYERMEKLISLLNIDAFLDLEDRHGIQPDRRHIHKILLHEPNYLLSYTHLAYQSYLIDPSSIGVFGKALF